MNQKAGEPKKNTVVAIHKNRLLVFIIESTMSLKKIRFSRRGLSWQSLSRRRPEKNEMSVAWSWQSMGRGGPRSRCFLLRDHSRATIRGNQSPWTRPGAQERREETLRTSFSKSREYFELEQNPYNPLEIERKSLGHGSGGKRELKFERPEEISGGNAILTSPHEPYVEFNTYVRMSLVHNWGNCETASPRVPSARCLWETPMRGP